MISAKPEQLHAAPAHCEPTQLATDVLALPSAFLHVHHAVDRLRPWLYGSTTVSWLLRGFSIDKPMTVLHQTFSVAKGTPETLNALATLGRIGLDSSPFAISLKRESAASFARTSDPYPTFSARRRRLCDEDQWRSNPFVLQFIKPADIGNSLASVTRVCPRGDIYLLTFINRPWNSDPFDDRHVDEVDELSRSMAPAFAASLPDMTPTINLDSGSDSSPVAQLTEAQRRLLPLLLSKLSEEEIAQHLHRSRHTVHTHAQQIYRALGLHGRRELLSRCVLGQLPGRAASPVTVPVRAQRLA